MLGVFVFVFVSNGRCNATHFDCCIVDKRSHRVYIKKTVTFKISSFFEYQQTLVHFNVIVVFWSIQNQYWLLFSVFLFGLSGLKSDVVNQPIASFINIFAYNIWHANTVTISQMLCCVGAFTFALKSTCTDLYHFIWHLTNHKELRFDYCRAN